jgi:hypothetical protein
VSINTSRLCLPKIQRYWLDFSRGQTSRHVTSATPDCMKTLNALAHPIQLELVSRLPGLET